jgi:hypothetical protein
VEEIMKFLMFSREKNNFDDILKDSTLKTKYKTKIEYGFLNMLFGAGLICLTFEPEQYLYIITKSIKALAFSIFFTNLL